MIARVVTRIAVVVVAALGAVAVYVATPASPEPPTSSTFSIAPPPAVVACPGKQTVPVGDVGAGGDLASEPTQRSLNVYAPVPMTPLGDGQAADSAVAAQSEVIGDGDIEGWSAMSCGQAQLDQWLVGGATSLGSSARLVLSNPSAAPSEATVTVYGPLGQVQTTLVVAVAPGAQVDKLVEAVAAELPATVLRVQATGPGLVAVLQDSRLEGFQPAGTEWVTPSDLAESLVIPAVGGQDPNASVTLRLMAPEGASVELSLVSDQGIEPWSVGHALVLEPGLVTDIDLPQGLAGAIEVRANGAVLASARTVVPRQPRESIDGEVAYDHTWVSGEALTEGTLAGVLPLEGARIAIYSPTNAHVVVRDSGGATVAESDLTARTVTWLDVAAPAGTLLSTKGEFAWAFVMESDAGHIASSEPVRVDQANLTATVVSSHYPAGA
ncbi:MAG: hypothetical protein HGA51_04395 [Demequinaceae bacterium]|nr:hypothetical protein [Demequinaceae bacterium]